MKHLKLLTLVLIILSCSSNPEENGVNDNGNTSDDTSNGNGNDNVFTEWSIPVSEVFDAAGRDGIPSIDNPVFISGQDTEVDNYMDPEDLVIGLKIGDNIRAYPHRILDWHEIVNDDFNGQKITVNYCPLTRTAFAWKYTHLGNQAAFGVSGLLYNSNLILYDKETNSNWSQMSLECVNGSELGQEPTLIDLVETNWETWKNMYPETEILSNEQGLSRNYLNYPYDGYLDSDTFLFFPVSPIDNRLNRKERVHGIIDTGILKAYRFQNFSGGNVFKDVYNSRNFLLVGNENVIKSFRIPTDLQNLEFTYSYTNNEEFFTDNTGNKWSINGEVIEGALIGRKLIKTKSITGFWFSLSSFYPNPEIY